VCVFWIRTISITIYCVCACPPIPTTIPLSFNSLPLVWCSLLILRLVRPHYNYNRSNLCSLLESYQIIILCSTGCPHTHTHWHCKLCVRETLYTSPSDRLSSSSATTILILSLNLILNNESMMMSLLPLLLLSLVTGAVVVVVDATRIWNIGRIELSLDLDYPGERIDWKRGIGADLAELNSPLLFLNFWPPSSIPTAITNYCLILCFPLLSSISPFLLIASIYLTDSGAFKPAHHHRPTYSDHHYYYNN